MCKCDLIILEGFFLAFLNFFFSTNAVQGLYEAFKEEASETGKEKLLLTLATASGSYYIDRSYEPDKIIKLARDYVLYIM